MPRNGMKITNMLRRAAITTLLIVVASASVHAEDIFADLTYYVRAGYSLGGTTPVGMPATIRKLSKFSPTTNIEIALDAYKPLKNKWGLMGGFHLENKGMDIDAEVKNYHMAMRQSDETLEGVFTGQVVTKVKQWMLTLMLEATYDVSSKVRLKLGPYLSYLGSNDFSGYAYDGYLRVDNPTGNKVELGTDEASWGTYDFTDEMRKAQFGFEGGVDWYFDKRFGAYFDLSWGVTGIFKKDFKTIEQTLYPIYGTVGLTYLL